MRVLKIDKWANLEEMLLGFTDSLAGGTAYMALFKAKKTRTLQL